MEPIELGKSLVAGFAADLVRSKSKAVGVAAGVIATGSLILAALLDGGLAWLFGFVAIAALGVLLVTVIGRWLLLRAVKLVADPASDPQQRVKAALEEADLPTGPVRVVRLLARLGRGGADDEIDRLRGVVTRLADDL